jgi:hypothetical protein
MKRWLALLIAVVLSGCSGLGFRKAADEPKVDPNLFPATYKSDIITYLQNHLFDATNIRDAALAPPVLKQFDTQYRYVVCVRYNGRDADHKYMGVEEKAVIYFGGKFNQFIDATPDLCGGAAYQAFPELQALKPLK